MEFYVSTNGNDLNSGEKNVPLKTLECAVKKQLKEEYLTVAVLPAGQERG